MRPMRLTPHSLGGARSRTRVITASKFERSPSLPTGGQGDQPLTCIVVLNQPPRGCCESGRQSGRRGKSAHSGRREKRPGAFNAEEFQRTAFTRPQLDPCSFVSSVVKTFGAPSTSPIKRAHFLGLHAGTRRPPPPPPRCSPRPVVRTAPVFSGAGAHTTRSTIAAPRSNAARLARKCFTIASS